MLQRFCCVSIVAALFLLVHGMVLRFISCGACLLVLLQVDLFSLLLLQGLEHDHALLQRVLHGLPVFDLFFYFSSIRVFHLLGTWRPPEKQGGRALLPVLPKRANDLLGLCVRRVDRSGRPRQGSCQEQCLSLSELRLDPVALRAWI